MNGILLTNGTFIEKPNMNAIDMVHELFPNYMDEFEVVATQNCIFIIEHKSLRANDIHTRKKDYLICPGIKKPQLTMEQLDFLKQNIEKLSMSQIIIIPELAALKKLEMFPKCEGCLFYAERYRFLKGFFPIWDQTTVQEYYAGKYTPEDFLDCCRHCQL